MEAERQIDLDVSDPAWADAPGEIVRAVLGDGVRAVTVHAHAAPTPSALSAQLLAFLRQQVETRGGQFSVPDPSRAFMEGLTLLGLNEVIIGTEDATQ